MLVQRNNLTGETRTWAENEPFNGREWTTIDSTKGDLVVDEVVAKSGLPLGDLVKRGIGLIPEAIRPKHCSRCEQRRLVLNRVRELGVVETLKKLREVS